MNKIYICRFTQDITRKKEDCPSHCNNICDVDGEICNSEVYTPLVDVIALKDWLQEGIHYINECQKYTPHLDGGISVYYRTILKINEMFNL